MRTQEERRCKDRTPTVKKGRGCLKSGKQRVSVPREGNGDLRV